MKFYWEPSTWNQVTLWSLKLLNKFLCLWQLFTCLCYHNHSGLAIYLNLHLTSKRLVEPFEVLELPYAISYKTVPAVDNLKYKGIRVKTWHASKSKGCINKSAVFKFCVQSGPKKYTCVTWVFSEMEYLCLPPLEIGVGSINYYLFVGAIFVSTSYNYYYETLGARVRLAIICLFTLYWRKYCNM